MRGVEGVLEFGGLTLCGVVLHSWLVVMRSCLLSVGGGGGGRDGEDVKRRTHSTLKVTRLRFIKAAF